MRPIYRNVFAVVTGIVVGCVVNIAIVIAGPLLIPVPDGVDMSDMENLAENLKLLKPANFLAPWLAHALGTFFGAWLAARLAASRKQAIAMGIGLFFLIGGITAVAQYGGPIWFAVLDLVGAYLPMGYLGGALGIRKTAPADD